MGLPVKRFLFLILITVNTIATAQSAIAPDLLKTLETEEKIDIVEMKKRLIEQNKQITALSKEVSEVDVDLGLNNKKYQKLGEDRALLDTALSNAKKNVDHDSESLKKSYAHSKNLLMGALLNKLENTDRPAAMLSRKILIENLQRRLNDLSGMMKTNKAMQADVIDLTAKLQDSMSTEKELLAILNELEQRRQELRGSLANSHQKKTITQLKFDEIKNKLSIAQQSSKKAKMREQLAPMQITEEIKIPSAPPGQLSKLSPLADDQYYPPIGTYNTIEYQKKGVTFNFQGKSEVRATRAGKIVYTGALANYGNVLMIDHGNDTRTVLLGQFDIAVKNGEQVKETQIVGYTQPESNSLGNGRGNGRIYFEVRKNNLAQNTYMLLDKKSLVKTSSN